MHKYATSNSVMGENMVKYVVFVIIITVANKNGVG
jgi:hypothetical protein